MMVLELGSHSYDDPVGRIALLRLIENIDAPSWLVRRVWDIVPPAPLMLIRELLNSSDVFLGEFNLLEVLGDPGWRHRLGNDGVTADLTPSQDDLRWASPLLFCNGFDFGACDEKWDVEEVVAECGVGRDVDVLLLGILDELLAGKDGVALDLIDRRYETGFLD